MTSRDRRRENRKPQLTHLVISFSNSNFHPNALANQARWMRSNRFTANRLSKGQTHVLFFVEVWVYFLLLFCMNEFHQKKFSGENKKWFRKHTKLSRNLQIIGLCCCFSSRLENRKKNRWLDNFRSGGFIFVRTNTVFSLNFDLSTFFCGIKWMNEERIQLIYIWESTMRFKRFCVWTQCNS